MISKSASVRDFMLGYSVGFLMWQIADFSRGGWFTVVLGVGSVAFWWYVAPRTDHWFSTWFGRMQ